MCAFPDRRNQTNMNNMLVNRPGYVFKRQFCKAWRSQVEATTTREKLHFTITDQNKEKEFLEAPEEDWEGKFSDYLVAVETVKAIIFERLDLKIIDKICRCITVQQILKKLDDKYQIKFAVSAIAARKKFYSLFYDGYGNMWSYIDLFERTAQELKDAGGTIEETEEMEQFIALVTPINFFQILKDDERNFETFILKNDNWKLWTFIWE